MLKHTSLLVAGLLLVATSAHAGPNWQTISLSVSPADAPRFAAALDKLVSAHAKDLTGSVALMGNVAGGDASHTIVTSFDTRAAREAWTQKVRTSPSWAKYASATAGLTEARSTSRMDFVKSWGEENDKDVFWEIFAFTVSDGAAFSSSLDAFLASDTGKKFPGQVHLSAVAAGGMSPATHLISVGFESEAEAEGWSDKMVKTKDWSTYQMSSRKAAALVGSFMIRTVKTWGDTGN